MTAFHHPATMPATTVGIVDRSVHRVGTALVRWSTARAERAARQHVSVHTAVAMTPALRHAAETARTNRELADLRSAGTTLLLR